MIIQTKQRLIGLYTFKFYYLFEAMMEIKRQISIASNTDPMIRSYLEISLSELRQEEDILEKSLAEVTGKLLSFMGET